MLQLNGFLFLVVAVLPWFISATSGQPPSPNHVSTADTTEGFTMMIATYKRDQLLELLLSHLTTTPPPSLRRIVVIWQNVGTPLPPFLLPPSLDTLSSSGVVVTVRVSKKNSMNERFRPTLDWGDEVDTEAVMVMDDDVVLRRETLEWGYQEFKKVNPSGSALEDGRIVGFTGRDFKKLPDGSLEYVVQPTISYSMVLSNAAWFRREWMQRYWGEDEEMTSLRAYVDEVFNCDDLLVNYVVSNLTHLPPLLLQPKTPLRTVPSSGLWNRGPQTPANHEPSTLFAPVVAPTTEEEDARPNHWLTRPVCLDKFFVRFSQYSQGVENDHYPLIRTSTSTSQDVVDHARWLYRDEGWQDIYYDLGEEQIRRDDEEDDQAMLEAMLSRLSDEDLEELLLRLEMQRISLSEELVEGEVDEEVAESWEADEVLLQSDPLDQQRIIDEL